MQLNKDNPYPQTLFHASLDPTQILNEEDREKRINEGYKDQYVPRAFPKHVATGKVLKIKSPWDDGITKVAETVVVRSLIEEKAILARLPDDDEENDDKNEDPPVVKRRGRPARVPELVEA